MESTAIWICSRLFFFQAEDGIRDYKVTGVQTCALPICLSANAETEPSRREQLEKQARWIEETIIEIIISEAQNEVGDFRKWNFDIIPHQIGRASCRERV